MTDSEVKPPSIMNIGLKYGLISTGIGILMFLALALSAANPFDNTWGWVRIAISIVIIVLAHREFKNSGDGFMSYGQGFKIGLIMILVGIVVGNLFTWFYTAVVDPGVMDIFYDAQRTQMEGNNMPDEQIDVAIEWTKKLFWPIAFVFGIIGGLIGVLIITIFTKKENPEPQI
ncbi:MAG TPA: DUF4199 domain-containing protein [Cyclobacteriaceae bacterium]|nr:DUF4199 domain-containing protein [Cyclobacteriaceae bacterium]